MKLLFTGDWHLRGNNPRNRIDDYPTAAVEKLQEVFRLAENNSADFILMPGDVWDRPEVSIAVLLSFADVLKASPVPIYATVGNHDIYGYNTASYSRSSLKLLEMLVEQLHVITDSATAVNLSTLSGQGGKYSVYLTATPYSRLMDIDGYGYGPDADFGKDAINVHIAHGMLLDHKPPFDRYSDLYKVPTTADNGSESRTPYAGDQPYTVSTTLVTVDGKPASIDGIVLNDKNGGGYTYFKVRDLCEALGFSVDWTAEKGVAITTVPATTSTP